MSEPKKIPVRSGMVSTRQEIDVLNDDVSELDEFNEESAEGVRAGTIDRRGKLVILPEGE